MFFKLQNIEIFTQNNMLTKKKNFFQPQNTCSIPSDHRQLCVTLRAASKQKTQSSLPHVEEMANNVSQLVSRCSSVASAKQRYISSTETDLCRKFKVTTRRLHQASFPSQCLLVG